MSYLIPYGAHNLPPLWSCHRDFPVKQYGHKRDSHIQPQQSAPPAARYARNDELGVPFAVTFDFETMEVHHTPPCLRLLAIHADVLKILK